MTAYTDPGGHLRQVATDLADEADDVAWWASETLTEGLTRTDLIRRKIATILNLGQELLDELNRLEAPAATPEAVR